MTEGGSSIPEVHALLRVLAAGQRAAEIGTAFGEGAQAIAKTAESLVTVAHLWLGSERLAAVEILTTPTTAAILATLQ